MAEKKKTPEKKPAGKKAAGAKAPAAEQAAAAETKAPERKAKARPQAPAAGPHAHLSFLRVAPRKVRLVADNVRGMTVGDALAMLKYTPQAACRARSRSCCARRSRTRSRRAAASTSTRCS